MKTFLPLMVALLMIFSAGELRSQPATDKAASESAERHFESLRVGELAFTNVWVHRQTNFNILIRHSRGIHTIKLSELPADHLSELQSQIGELADITPPSSGLDASGLLAKLKALLGGASQKTLLVGGVVGFLLVLLLILKCRKSDAAPPAS